MDRIILHCDLNCFYASVEMLYHPETRHLPVAVAGNPEKRHGIILTKNPLAKSYGIKTAEAIWQAKAKCPNLIIYPPDYRKYLKFSFLVKKIFSEYTDKVESFGIDEAWLDITHSYHLFGSPYHTAYLIKERIKEELGITLSIGLSYNKVLAKLGSDYKKYDCIVVINRANKAQIVDPLPVSDLLFVGRSTTAKLNHFKIFTIGQLANTDYKFLHKIFGKIGPILHAYANGLECSEVTAHSDSELVKSIGNSSTTVIDMSCYQEAYLVLSVLSQSVASRLKKQGLKGICISVSIRTKDLEHSSFQTTLIQPTWLYREILTTGFTLLKKNYQMVKPLRSIGISISKLVSAHNYEQLDLFDQQKKEHQLTLDLTLDSIRQRFGYHCINYASLKVNQDLTDFNPKEEHVIFPTGWRI